MGVSESGTLQEHMDDPPITALLGPIDRLISQLQSLEGCKHNMPVELSVNQIRLLIKYLKEFRNPMKNLSEIEDTSFMDRWWMKEVRELCYDTEDYLEEVIMQYGANAPRTWTRLLLEDVRIPFPLGRIVGIIIFWIHSKLKWRPQFSHFLARAKVLKGRCPYSFDKGKVGDTCLNKEIKADISLKKEDRADIENLIVQLVKMLAFDDKQTQLKVVPIYGFAGAGKTILARTLYDRYKRRFECWAFVRVSRNPDIRSILTSIISQIKAPPASPTPEVPELIVSISRHLERKRYFVVIDDVQRTPVWDIFSRAFPGDNCGSRIIITTGSEHVASAFSGYNLWSTIFKMDALNACTNTITSEEKNEDINLRYNSLPVHLKTCLLYLAMHPEGCTITKDDLVKQWVAEGFIPAIKRQDTEETSEIPQNKTEEILEISQYKTEEIGEVLQDKRYDISETLQDQAEEIAHVNQDQREEIAGGYFDELVTRGMIQPVDRDHKGEVLSCTVHHMVLDLIRYKSKDENFLVVVDNLESTLGHPDIVRRLSVQFGCEKGASIPESIILSQVRSLTFHGFLECVPSIADYGLLRVLILNIWADEDKIFDLTRIGELYHLRYLNIECNITVRLPSKIRMLQHLGTLELHAEVESIPSDIGHLKKLAHICCPGKADVHDLVELTNLLDLELTWSTVENLQDDMECLRSILEKISSLRCLALVPASGSCSVNTQPATPSIVCISCDSLCIVSPAPANLQRLELSRHCCILSRLPNWIGELRKLCILKIAVGELSKEDIGILNGLPALASLSLHVATRSTEKIVFGNEGFSVLRYFKFMCTEPWLKFEAGAMPNLEKLKLCFSLPMRIVIIERLSSGLKEISAIISCAGVDAGSAWREAIINDTNNPEVLWMGSIYCGDQDRGMVTTEPEHGILEELVESMEEEADVIQANEIMGDCDETDGVQDEGLGEDENKEAADNSPFWTMDAIYLASAATTWALNKLLDRLKDDAIRALMSSRVHLTQGKDLVDALRRANHVLGCFSAGTTIPAEIKNKKLVAQITEVQDMAVKLDKQLDKLEYYVIGEKVKNKNLENTSMFISKVKSMALDGPSKQTINRYDIREIKDTADKLEKICNDVYQALVVEKLGQIVEATKNMDIDTREAVDNRTETKVFPREEENDIRHQLITASDQELLVLPIVGDGGVGKTTLAREVYNDPRVRDKFPMRIWIYVSAKFNEVKISQGILQQIPGCEYKSTTNLTVLQGSIKKYLTGKFLIVLDDVWEEREGRWDKLLAPLRCTKEKGVILVTTRKLSVANVTSRAHINLDGMQEDMFRSFFRRCIFGDENYRTDRKLMNIAKQIAPKLKGNPLAAKSVGALLRKKCHEHAWRNILDRDEWKTENETDDIIPALKLSYNHLSNHLQQLFSYCALFPKGYRFDKEQLIRMWIALGFVTHERKTLENVGSDSFDELVYGSFFQKEEQYFILHDLMHDVAQEVSMFKCLTIDGPAHQNAPQSVHRIRHVGIWTEMVYREGSMERSEIFEEKLDMIQDGDILKSLESFMLVGVYDENFSAKLKKTLDQLDYVQLLRLSMHFNVYALESSVKKFIHLRYLELRYTSDERRPLPEAICKLYHLLVLDIMHWNGLDDLPKAINNLVHLRYLLVPGSGSLHSKISRVGEMEFLQELNEFRAQEGNGFEISQLGSLKEIGGSLSILDLENVTTKQEASKARIKDKKHLRTLSLSWSSARGNAAVQKEVIEGLKPHDRLAHLHIINYAGATPSWIAVEGLESIHLQDCTAVEVLPPFEELEFLKKLSLIGMSSLRDVNIASSFNCGTASQSCEEDEIELSEVEIARCSALTSIRLNFRKILTKFSVEDCVALSSIEGLPSSDQRQHYVIKGCPQLPANAI